MATARSSRPEPPSAPPVGPPAAPRPAAGTPAAGVQRGTGDPAVAAGDHAALVAAVVRLGDLLEDTRDMLATLTDHVARGAAQPPASPSPPTAPPASPSPPAPAPTAAAVRAPALDPSSAPAGRATAQRAAPRGPRPEPPSVLADHLRAPGDEDGAAGA